MPQPIIKNSSDLNQQKLERSILLDRSAVNLDKRTVDLAFATETPVKRWFGLEILDCKPRAVDLKRLLSGGPVLVGHESDDQVGVVESASVDKDGTCRATVKFGRSVRAQEILQDIGDGIRRNVSVGYMVHANQIDSEKDNIITYRVTSWEPYEVSIVPMPADINCGIGREMKPNQSRENKTMIKCTHCGIELAEGIKCTCSGARSAELAALAQNDSYELEQARSAAVLQEQARVKSISDMGEKYAGRGGKELAARLILDPRATVDNFTTEMLDRITRENHRTIVTRPQPALNITADLRYNRSSLKPFERFNAKAEEMAYRAGMWCKAVIWGDSDARRWCADHDLQSRVMSEISGSVGGFLVPDELETAITDLRVTYGVARKICRIVPMGSAACQIPVRTAGTTAYFVAEKTAGTASDMTWGQAELVAKNLNAETRISTNLAEDAVIDIAALVADEHAQAFAAKEDGCMVVGDGTSTYGGIRGLNTLFEAAYSTLKGCYACATNTDSPQEVIASEISGLMGKLPSYARSRAVHLASPTFDEMIFSRLMAAGGGNTTITLAGQIIPQYLGKPREVNEYMPSDSTADLTNKVISLYGAFGMACLIGDRRGITIQVLREVLAQSGQIVILGTERFDFNGQFAIGDTTAPGPVVALIGG